MKIEIPEKKKRVFEMRIPIRWGDMDAMNHVNTIWVDFPNQKAKTLPDWMRALVS